MEAIPQDWVEKIFNCMADWYGERWTKGFEKAHVEQYLMVIWKNGLQGCSYDEIKHALRLCKRAAENKSAQAPHIFEFFRYAKGYTQPHINYHPKANDTGNPEIASKYLSEIKQKLRSGAVQEIYRKLGQ